MDFLEGDFPFVVAFDAGEGHHWVERAGEALLSGVVLGLRQLVMAVFEQVAGDVRLGQSEVEWYGVGFGVPVGGAVRIFRR